MGSVVRFDPPIVHPEGIARTRRRIRITALALVLGASAVLGDSRLADAQSAHGWLGVELDSTRAGASARGVRVRHTVKSSPAWNAGVRDGDVILRVDQMPAVRPDDVIREVASHAPGSSVRLSLARGAIELALDATLAEMPEADEMLRLDKVGSPAPSWQNLSTVSGALPEGVQALRGRVVLLDFWAAWCVACRMATPKLSSWQAKFGAQGLSVIGITDDPPAEASQGVSSFGMKYAGVGTDTSYVTQRAFGVRALPTIFVIDKRGVIRDVSVGFDPHREAEIERLLVRLLAESVP
ncbi:MAG TPA: redoxin domain-containing protein [Polyangiaceae bacterium]|jgi:thiol-disulfide isomerase/thioredoxin